MAAPYVPLWVNSSHTFGVGASHPEELVDTAAHLGLPAMALTDRHGVFGAVRAHVRARAHGLAVLVGAEVWVEGQLLVMLAADRRGYGNLCRLLTLGHLAGGRGHFQLARAALCRAADGLVVLAEGAALAGDLKDALGGRLFALCARHLRPGEAAAEAATCARARALGVKVVAATRVLYHARARAPLQAVMTCIRRRTTLAAAGRALLPNFTHELPTPARMHALFADQPAWLAATAEVAKKCAFRLDDLVYRYPGGGDDDRRLKEVARAGVRAAYVEAERPVALGRLEEELALIAELGFAGHFLTMHEVVDFCRRENIFCQGRGSAANSIVCFSLGITAIDPVKMRLLFARFLSRERAEPPDIDLDIEHRRREEVIQWVYRRFGRRHAAMVANVARFRIASAVREVGLVFGLAPAEVDVLGHRLHAGATFAEVAPPSWRQIAFDLLDMPRHLSCHPGGFLLGRAPVDELVPVQSAAMPGRTVVQWDKNDVEDMRMFKLDLLGLGALGHVRLALEMVALQHAAGGAAQAPRSLAEVPVEDPATYRMLRRGDAMGVFQLESRAQMAMLPRLAPETFYDLVVEVAIVRPGPIQGDMVHPYLRRRAGLAPVALPHPDLVDVLGKTYGVPIFQEQVMQLAMRCARYTPGEADRLRRDMAAWRSHGRILEHRQRLVERMVDFGIGRDFAEAIFRQIEGFGEYGFPESHAASFAHIAYVTAWLRCHHPAAFTCALLNAQPMGFYAPSTLVEDARRRGVEVRPISVDHSDWACRLEDLERRPTHPAVRMGLSFVRGLDEARGRAIAAARPFTDLADLGRRGGASPAVRARLARAGALADLAPGRRQALWAQSGVSAWRAGELPLKDPVADAPLAPLARAEAIAWDYVASGHSTLGHPMAALRPELDGLGVRSARALAQTTARGGGAAVVVGLVICRQQPESAGGVFFLTLEDETGWVNVVVWPQVLARYTALVRAARCLAVAGRRQSAHGVVHLVADRIWQPAHKPPVAGLPPGRQTR